MRGLVVVAAVLLAVAASQEAAYCCAGSRCEDVRGSHSWCQAAKGNQALQTQNAQSFQLPVSS